MAIFIPKSRVNPFAKMSIFPLLNFMFLQPRKVFCSFQKIRERDLPCLFWRKKKLQKWPFLDRNHGLTPLGKCQFFEFLNFLFYCLERRFFVLECHKRHFPGLYCQKNKKLEKWPFFDQNHGLTPLEKCQFFDFLDFLFFKPRKAFFRSRIS